MSAVKIIDHEQFYYHKLTDGRVTLSNVEKWFEGATPHGQ